MYLLLGIMLFVLFLVGVLVDAIIRQRSQSRAKDWPVTLATVEDTAGIGAMGRADPAAVIRYSYSVEGQQYSGSYRCPFLSEDDVGMFLASFLRGTTFPVHYNPAAPQDSQPSEHDLHKLIKHG